jgi:hypothetical protein
LHAVLQQKPSTQYVLAHSALFEHADPVARVAQAPAPLHEMAPKHSLSGSVEAAMLPHVPSVPEPFFTSVHAWQTPVHAAPQQTPSTQ